MIAGTLKGIVSQRLVRTPDGNGRVAVCEIMVMTGRVHDMILDPKQTGMLGEVIAEGGYYGMQTFDQHLLEHLQAGRITMEDAVRTASSPHDFKLMVAAQSRIGPRSHPNKGEGKIDGAAASRPRGAPAVRGAGASQPPRAAGSAAGRSACGAARALRPAAPAGCDAAARRTARGAARTRGPAARRLGAAPGRSLVALRARRSTP